MILMNYKLYIQEVLDLKGLLKKAVAVVISTCIFSSVSIHSLLAESVTNTVQVPQYVRVGLEYKYKNVKSVPITNKTIALVSYSLGAFNKDVEISAKTAFSMNLGTSYYIDLKQNYKSYDDAYNAANGYNDIDVVPVMFNSGVWGTYAWGFSSYSDASTSALLYNGVAVQPDGSILELKDGLNPTVIFKGNRPQIMASAQDKVITLNDRSYRGAIEFGIYKGTLMTAVNVVGFEEYLYSVVPSEMPPSYNIEALKSQSCAARTYAMTKIGAHSADGYELCDGINCQVYKGYTGETVTTTLAVDATKGQVIYYKGVPINAVFFSNSGGYTEESENVWLEPMEYLKSVPEISEYDTKVWTRTFTKSQINSILNSTGANIGSVTNIVIAEASPSGRVQKLNIVGTSGTKVLTKEAIRTFFASAGGSLDSRLFTVNGSGSVDFKTDDYQTPNVNMDIKTDDSYIIGSFGNSIINGMQDDYKLKKKENINSINTLDKFAIQKQYSATADTFTIKGKGSGHGVGMSQKGAEGMARIGYKYIDILKHYYTGVEIK